MKKYSIPVSQPFLGEEEARAVYKTVKSGWLRMGQKVEEFEEKCAHYLGVKHAVAMFNGTVTLHAILAALDIGPGDEIIVPTLNYISAANVVCYQKAKLVLCDVDLDTLNTTADLIESKITKRTRAIMPVDLYGLPVDYSAINKIGKKYGVPIIGDSAESFGAKYRGKRIGSQALAHSFSFFPNKNITTGEGGLITTNNSSLAKKLRILRNQGQEGRYNHTYLGFNYRMTEMQAAIGIEQLKKIGQIINDKNRIVRKYNQLFKKYAFIKTPRVPDYVSQHAWFLYTIVLDQNIDRERVRKRLDKFGIETRVSFQPIHKQPYLKDQFRDEYPNGNELYKSLLNLPIWYGLTDAHINAVVNAVSEACNADLAGKNMS